MVFSVKVQDCADSVGLRVSEGIETMMFFAIWPRVPELHLLVRAVAHTVSPKNARVQRRRAPVVKRLVQQAAIRGLSSG